MIEPTPEEHVLFLYRLSKLGPTNLRSPEFRFQYFSTLILTRCSKIPTDALIRELEECYMEIQMAKPRTEQDFLFWAWADTTFDHEDADAWELRFHMMQYHFHRATRPQLTLEVLKL